MDKGTAFETRKSRMHWPAYVEPKPDVKVRDLMTSNVYTVKSTDRLDSVYEIMETVNVRHVPVVDSDDNLVGLISERDMIRNALYGSEDLPVSVRQPLLHVMKANEIMRTEVETIDPNEDAAEAGKIMLDNKFGCLPVVEGTHLVGIITEADFIRYFVFGREE